MAQHPLHFADSLLFFQALALVVELLATGKAKLDLRLTIIYKIYLERNKRNSFFIQPADQLADFLPVQEQLALPQRVGGGMGAEGVGRNMDVVQKNFAASDSSVAVFEIGLSSAERLHFRPGKNNPRLHRFINMIVVVGFFVGAGYFHRNSARLRRLMLIERPADAVICTPGHH